MFSLSGLVLILVVMTVPYLAKEIRDDPKVSGTVFVVLLIKQVVTFLHITIGPLPTVNGDPVAFNYYAMWVPRFESLGGNLFLRHLRAVYDTLGGSHLLGCEIAQLGYSVALVFFVKLLVHLGYRKTVPSLILMFALIPSALLNTSVVLREPWQMAGYLGLVWSLVTLRSHLVTSALTLLVSSVMLVYFHNGLGAYVCIAVPLGLAVSTVTRPGVFVVLLSAALALVPFLGGFLLESIGHHSVVVSKLADGDTEGAVDYIEGYQKGVNDSRSAFPVTLDLSSGGAFLKTGSIVMLYYSFSPFPWQVRSVLDILGFAESCLRMALFACAIQEIKRAKDSRLQDLASIWAVFLLMEIVWAAGTANTGTAVRHRLVAWGALVALGGGRLLNSFGVREEPMANEPQASSRGLRKRLREARRQQ